MPERSSCMYISLVTLNVLVRYEDQVDCNVEKHRVALSEMFLLYKLSQRKKHSVALSEMYLLYTLSQRM